MSNTHLSFHLLFRTTRVREGGLETIMKWGEGERNAVLPILFIINQQLSDERQKLNQKSLSDNSTYVL